MVSIDYQIQCKVQSFWEGNYEKGLAMMSLDKYKATLEVRYIICHFDITFLYMLIFHTPYYLLK